MLKQIGCTLTLVAILAMTVLVGCEDKIRTERTVEMKDVPIGEPQPVID